MGSPPQVIQVYSPPTVLTMMTPVHALLLTVLSLSQGTIPDALMRFEKEAFKLCESDGEVGLTWIEVEACEVKYAEDLVKNGWTIPTEEAFHDSDLNKDGTLMFEEWMQWEEEKEGSMDNM